MNVDLKQKQRGQRRSGVEGQMELIEDVLLEHSHRDIK